MMDEKEDEEEVYRPGPAELHRNAERIETFELCRVIITMQTCRTTLVHD